MTRLDRLAQAVTQVEGDGSRPFVALEHLASGLGALLPGADLPIRDPDSVGMVSARAGDVLFGKLRPYLAKSWRATHQSLCSSELIVMRPGPHMSSRWLGYLAQSRLMVDWAIATSDGVKMPRTSWDKLRFLDVHPPTMADQERMAEFLDAKVSRIDRLLQLNDERVRVAAERIEVATAAAFRDPPWPWVPLKSVASYREGPGILATDIRDHGVPLLRIVNLVNDSISLHDLRFLDPEMVDSRWSHMKVRAGELIVSGSATSGLPVVVPQEAVGSVPWTGLIRVWPSTGELDREYLRMFLGSLVFLDQVNRLRTGVAIQHWGPTHLAQVRIPVPPLLEQQRIARKLARARESARHARAATLRQSDLLQERRQALITAAVTGQLEIPGVAA